MDHTLQSGRPGVKVSPVVLSDTPQLLPARLAARLVRQATYVACYVTMGAGGAADLVDVSKSRALRLLKRHTNAWVSELFGTIVLGRPEPATLLPAWLEPPDEE